MAGPSARHALAAARRCKRAPDHLDIPQDVPLVLCPCCRKRIYWHHVEPPSGHKLREGGTLVPYNPDGTRHACKRRDGSLMHDGYVLDMDDIINTL